MNGYVAILLYFALFWSPVISFLSSCNKLSPAEKQAQFMASINAATTDIQDFPSEPEAPAGVLNTISSSLSDIRNEQKAVCGNGIIEGDEYCDRDNISHRRCSDFGGGISGEIGCTVDCLLDISRCITVAVDDRIGGIAEVCKCTCDNNSCQGGCTPALGPSLSTAECLFMCDNSCTCRCEGKLETHIQYCSITCLCTDAGDTPSTPLCQCSLDECETITVIAPNIAELVNRKARPAPLR